MLSVCIMRARSHREFVARIGVVLEEADESGFWLTLLKRSGLSTGEELNDLLKEAGELTAIFTESVRNFVCGA
jgi:four helix bundle protein